MMKLKAVLPLLIAFGLLTFSGCAKPPRVVVPPPAPGMERTLIEKAEEAARMHKALAGFARVRVTAGGRSMGGNQVLLLQAPDRLRAEVLSPFGQPILVVATDGMELTAIAPGEGRFYQGEASYANIQRFTRIPLDLEDLVGLLLYRVPLLPAVEPEVAATPEGYLLSLHGADLRQRLLFDPRLRLVRSTWHRGDALLLQAEYGDFPESGPLFPRTLSLRVPPQGVEANIAFSELDLNPGITPERFRLTPPEGYRIEPLP